MTGTAGPERLAGWLTRRRVRLYYASLGGAVWVAWLASQLLGPGLLDATGKIAGTDFLAFYTAGHFIAEGRGGELYDFEAQTALQEEVGSREEHAILFPFVNPPFTAWIYAPLSAGGYARALASWWLLGLAALAAALVLLRRELGDAGAGVGRWLAAGLLFFPTVVWFMHGQNSPVSLLLYALTFVLLRRGRDGWAGAALGCLVFKPQLALAPAFALVAARRWRAIAAGALVVAVWLAAGALLLPDATRAYMAFAPELPELLRQSPKAWGIHSFFGGAFLLFDGLVPALTNPTTVALSVAALGVIGWAWWDRDWRPGERRWDLTMAGTLALGILVSPHLFTYDLMLLAVPLAIVWTRFDDTAPERDLDGGPLLGRTAILYGAVVASSYLAQGQLAVTTALGLPPAAVQVSTAVIAWWSWRALTGADRPAPAGVS